MTHGSYSSSVAGTTSSTTMMPEKRIFAKSGHVCMMCGFKATTKNKYRELQDHLVRQHFQDRIKSALPTRRPFLCPDHSCNVEGKDWQALMRHYTGKHGVLEAYIKEFMASQMEHKENLHLGRPVSPLPPTNKIGCRRKRYKRHSSGDQQDNPMAAEDRTEDTPPIITSTTSLSTTYEPNNHSENLSTSTCEYITQDELITTTVGTTSQSPISCHLAEPQGEEGNTILQLDDCEPAPIPPTHLALVLKKRKVGKDGMELEGEPEETYAFVDLKYFQPLSANQYLMKSQVIDPNLLAIHQASTSASDQFLESQDLIEQQSGINHAPPPPLITNGANGGGCYFLESGVQSPVSAGSSSGSTATAVVENQAAEAYFESFPHQNNVTSTVVSSFVSSSNYQLAAANGAAPEHHLSHDTSAFRECYDQVVPNHNSNNPIQNCATEVEVSSNGNQCSNNVVMQVPITNSSSVATVSVMAEPQTPKGSPQTRIGCSKVVVETVKSIPMDQAEAGNATSYELISHEGLNGMKEIDFTMF